MSKTKHKDIGAIFDRIEDDRSYTISEAARVIGVSRQHVHRGIVKDGEAPFAREPASGTPAILGADLRRWVESRWGENAMAGAASPRAKVLTPVDGDRVRHWREKRGLSKAELSRRSGVSYWTLVQIEQRGRGRGARRKTVEALAGALGISPRTLGATEERREEKVDEGKADKQIALQMLEELRKARQAMEQIADFLEKR